ncbi:AKAP7 2'5' RNA ligase-like domain-containing protein [Geopyxis carbonaria]|nr:AKAP7 2'5' RNA ligase-like domain-containing protein [Geopyxis carbonaria]
MGSNALCRILELGTCLNREEKSATSTTRPIHSARSYLITTYPPIHLASSRVPRPRPPPHNPHRATRHASMPPRKPRPSTPKQRLTHFLSLPLHHAPGLPAALAALRTTLLTAGLTPPAGSLRPAACLHLTLGVMSLATAAQLTAAVALLRSLDFAQLLAASDPAATDSATDPATDPAATPAAPATPADVPPLQVSLRGLATMGVPWASRPAPAAAAASVLYMPPHDATARLQGFAERVRAAFVTHGLVADDGRPLRLHATVLNTVYARGKMKGVKMDFREVVEREQDRVWVEGIGIGEVVVCGMGAREVGGVKGAGGYEVVGRAVIRTGGGGEAGEAGAGSEGVGSGGVLGG